MIEISGSIQFNKLGGETPKGGIISSAEDGFKLLIKEDSGEIHVGYKIGTLYPDFEKVIIFLEEVTKKLRKHNEDIQNK